MLQNPGFLKKSGFFCGRHFSKSPTFPPLAIQALMEATRAQHYAQNFYLLPSQR